MLPESVVLGRASCGNLAVSSAREWLVTNGLGGYALGTVSGIATRRYHGLLVAALRPPVGRTMLVAGLDETVRAGRAAFPLATNRWHDGTIAPGGYRFVERFRLYGSIPVWTYALGDDVVEKRVWMEHGANTTYVTYTVHRAAAPLDVSAKALVTYRDAHDTIVDASWQPRLELADERRVIVTAHDGNVRFAIATDRGRAILGGEWYRAYDLAAERERGLGDRDDRYRAATFEATLAQGESLTIAMSVDSGVSTDGEAALAREIAREEALLALAPALDSPKDRQLVLAADQFVVARGVAEDDTGRSVIAGYPWFDDWGRDTMIALPGLTLSTGRPGVAASILSTFATFVSEGMIPNTLPAPGERPSYNSVDASLWYIEAVRRYFEATDDVALVQRLFPALVEIVDAYASGTRFGIREDGDGLIACGEPGVQLTWMDAKVGDFVVTPRIGKPVEVGALWYNALCTVSELARRIGKSPDPFAERAERTRAGFERFWNVARDCCYDVIDGPDGDDPSLRPNQLLAVSLAHSALAADRQRRVVDACAPLVTTRGLRSLSPDDPRFRPTYAGDQSSRDGAYHQGTVWTWLIGPYLTAHLRVYGDPEYVLERLRALVELDAYGLGTLGEIADGGAPFTPAGAPAQAWSVAEVLRLAGDLQAGIRP